MLTTGATTNWAGNITFGAARLHHPATPGELRRIVGLADRVRVLGTGHSFNRIADTDGDLVSLDRLPPRVEIAPDGSTATIAAGMRYAQVAEELHTAGYALANLASLPHITVAGACATATHGSGNVQRCLAASVAGLEIVGPEGDVTELRRDNEADRLSGAVVGLGGLGVVTSMTLDIEPAYEVAQWVWTGLPLDRLGDSFDEIFAAAYSVSVFTDWQSDEGVVWLKCRTDLPGPPEPGQPWLGARPADRHHHPVPAMPPLHCTEQLGAPGPWHERLPHFRPDFTPSNGDELQSELILPRTAATEAFAALRSLGDRIAPVVQVSEVRTVAADDLWLSPAYGRDSVALHFTWVPDHAAVIEVVAAMEELLLPLGARPHWGKLTTVAPERIVASYERAADFGRLLADHDPAGKFRNPFLDGFFPADSWRADRQ
ncbi:sorbitol oxidase [Streptomyces himastatinicus ATCC 53653]|uniref:Sorbitol oxidase n=1 Tax=Streptomyces himastatinicus ATCC 53653 TaxID=457427 RepID=D9WDS5_9ACTN|nr:FAD-binding protein [Streptomyces himastatinicus]EFL20985.1 sorbitol oxidase [Streptomyces himastatinicus ATCC 53653]